MNKLVVVMLAATALAPAGAVAQRTVSPPVKWQDTPHVQMHMPPPSAPPAGAGSWRGWQGNGPMMPRPDMHRFPGPHAPGAPNVVMHHGGNGMMMRHHGVRNFSNYRRFDRGFVLPQFWWGPQFQISNWGMYGLPQPMQGGRWVRYYDDALMLDGSGRVMDGRWGMNWDRWGDQWDYDDRGVPIYVGNGDYYPGDRDYAWVEGDRGGYGESYSYREECHCAPPPYPYGYGSGYGYGYGWGYGGTVVVTETTVTTAPSVATETYYEEEVVHQRAHKAKRYRAKPRYHRPVPLPGERG